MNTSNQAHTTMPPRHPHPGTVPAKSSNMITYVIIGKDGHTVPIMAMATLRDAVWKKSACFDHLHTQ